jgi:hypothetical protein
LTMAISGGSLSWHLVNIWWPRDFLQGCGEREALIQRISAKWPNNASLKLHTEAEVWKISDGLRI